MAYGRTCPVCGGTVDNNEYDYTKDMCKDCAFNEEMEDIQRTEVAKIMNSDYEQMALEV